MIDRWQAIQGKILPASPQRFLGKIDIKRNGTGECGANGEGVRVSKAA